MIFKRKASQQQINKLIYEGLACAVVLANLKNTPIAYAGTTMLYGDHLRPYLSGWFETNSMPENIKTFLIETFVKPECDIILSRKGMSHGVTDYIFHNINTKEADIIINEFISIRNDIRKDRTVLEATKEKTKELSQRKSDAKQNATEQNTVHSSTAMLACCE